MRQLLILTMAMVACAAALPVAAAFAQAPAAMTDQAIDQAIDKAVAWLWTQQQPDGLWPHKSVNDARGVPRSQTGSRWPPGEHVMAMMALEYAGVPLDDPRFQKGLKVMLELELTRNYIIGSRVVTLAHMYHRSKKAKQPGLRKLMKRDVDQLVANQGKIGGWRYTGPPSPPRTIDFSNTQLVILAMSEAAKCGVEVPQEAMYRAHKRIIEDQKEDGGWNYGCYGGADVPNRGRDEPSYGNMTAACTASLFLTDEFLTGGLGCPCKGGRSGRGKDIVGDSLDRGMAWLNKEFLPDRSPKGYHWFYWIYQAERVGIATGYRYFGTHDWYKEICGHLLPKQNADGSFGNTVSTSFSILFLVKGRAPILYNKLQYNGPWNLHRFDLKNLMVYIGREKEQRVAWQVIQESTPVELWHDAPVLFISTEQKIELSDELKKKLRAYTDGGGTLLLESSCGNGAAKKFWLDLVKELWPEWELERVDNKHAVWTADVPIRGRKPVLQHMHDGVRSIIFYAPSDISCMWHLSVLTKYRPAFDLGMNLAAYAGDKAPLRRRLSGPMVQSGQGIAGQTIAGGGAKAMKIAHLAHGGDYYAGQNYGGLKRLAAFVGESAGLTVEVAEKIDPAADTVSLKDYGLLWLNGRTGVTLGEAARAKIKAYLSGGGFLVAESVMGDARFAAALTTLTGEMGLVMKPLGKDHAIVSGKLAAGNGYDVSSGVRFSRALKVERIGRNSAALTGLYLGDRLVGVFSPYDVLYSLTGCPAYDRRGYAPDHAMAVGANLVLQAAASAPAGG